MSGEIFGLSWREIQSMQQRRALAKTVDLRRTGDHGSDPMGDGMFRMVPSGDIVDLAERNKRLQQVTP